MRILYLCHRIPYPPNKGDKIRSFNELKYLATFHEIHLATLADDPGDVRHEAALEKYCTKIALVTIRPAVEKIRSLFSLFRNRSLSVDYFHAPALQCTVDDWLSRYDYDAVVCFSSPMAEYLFASPACRHWWGKTGKACRPRLVMDFCDVDSDKWLQYSRQAALPMKAAYFYEYRKLFAFEQKINRAFDASVFVSPQETELFRQMFPRARNTETILNGVDDAYFAPGQTAPATPDGPGPVLLFTGAMDYHANADGVCWFCEAILPLLKRKYPDLMFYIVGSNPLPSVKKLESHHGVRVTGFVEDIRPYYEMADVSVIPLRLARGIQNKVLEAMSMGKAVVSTGKATDGIGAIPGEHLLMADHPQAFSESLIRLIGDETQRRTLGENARSFVRNAFDWQGNMKKLNHLIAP
ncbi:sugar transferase [Desulfonema ishimotonii]|uniref:Sugar transferase n=1 Tax=Desulfonema ishimotonii TaxID=45657 RepID=A0A401FQP6_9BACT|nr:TIGR03087 family PEP-CTERM/XrtA system glycosyltransferase [Desulfonema ishimotonii]GBC59245.1 sugar transferase [Desulfonema ishimotonii]